MPLGIVALLLLWLFNWQKVEDWWKLRSYTPPSEIEALAVNDTMTDEAKHLFYINHPQLINTDFAKSCPVNEQTIVLGCYRSVEAGIYLFKVEDARLKGVEEVTAAHEMLHAAYDRLSSTEKKDVNTMLNDYLKQVQDKRILDTIELYKKTEPNDVIDEIHSIFGTEISSLPPKLETYYQRYFLNRAQIVSYANNYQQEFISRINQIKAYEQQLLSIKQKIDAERSSLSAQLSKIKSDRAELDSLRSSGQFAAYNSRVATFNAEVDSYNNQVGQLRADINAYNDIVNLHNQLAKELRNLYDSIDTRLAPQSLQ